MAKIKKRLGELLVDSGVITDEVLEKALKMQKELGKKLGEVLVSEGFTTNDLIVDAVKSQLGIQSINLSTLNIRPEIIDTIPEIIARKYEVLPVDIVNGQLLVVMADPLNYYAIEEIKMSSGYVVKTAIALRDTMLSNIEKYYGQSKAREAAEDYGRVYGFKEKNVEQVEEDENTAPVIKFLNTIIENAILNGASDIHIEPDEQDMRVRFRIDGVLREMMRVNIGMLDPVISRIKIMANLNIAEKRVPQDGRISFRAKEKNIDLRISTAPTMWGEKIVMRLLDKSNFSLNLGTLGLDNSDLSKINRITSKPFGIILVCGPTGSGKTTSLYSILNVLNEESKNIITIEDPVEYNFKGINQMQVNSKIGFDFANGLRSILRQDPDIIMVGEIRDGETAEISVRSALTGHLVLSTIHTNNAAGTITRMQDMGIEPFLISSTVTGIMAQRLVRKICPNCGEEHLSDERETRLLGLDYPITLKKGKGCSLCNNSGYKGRIGIYEIMEISPEIRNLIDKKAPESEIEAIATKQGMVILRQACISKVKQGLTTVDEMMRVTYGF
ncbi:MAG: Flp pilus assembly complex ATPase component TadA [Clostridiaceae bacterium]|nr:Flp pilus assembly complex ATPase component TadA [Clostridiaceae bacterium]